MLWRGQGPLTAGGASAEGLCETPSQQWEGNGEEKKGGGRVLLHGRGDHLLLRLHSVLVGVLVLFGPASEGQVQR